MTYDKRITDLAAVAAERAGKNAGVAPQLLMADITFAIADAVANHQIILGEDTPRYRAYLAIDGERDYQTAKWGVEKPGNRNVHAYLNYMQVHLDKAREGISSHADPVGTEMALHEIRKVTALGVACAEMNGVLTREDEQASEQRHIDALRAGIHQANGVMPA